MKHIALLALFFLAPLAVFACPACEKQQPKILRGITHGAGPQSNWDYVIIWTTVIIVAVTLYYSLRWLIRPGEKSNGHIKRTILNDE